MSQLDAPHGKQTPHQPASIGLILSCCLPTIVIALILIAAGGVRPGFLIPAVASGVMIGMLMYITLDEKRRQ